MLGMVLHYSLEVSTFDFKIDCKLLIYSGNFLVLMMWLCKQYSFAAGLFPRLAGVQQGKSAHDQYLRM